MQRNSRPVMAQHGLRIRLYLDKLNGLHPCSLETERKPANPGKKIENIHAAAHRHLGEPLLLAAGA
jgi:hypothetical protein